jgi:hypothetical protein
MAQLLRNRIVKVFYVFKASRVFFFPAAAAAAATAAAGQ